jgi:hypothetical protein
LVQVQRNGLEHAAQPCRHHPEPLVVLVDGHAALVEVEEHADAVALVLRALPVSLPVVAARLRIAVPVTLHKYGRILYIHILYEQHRNNLFCIILAREHGVEKSSVYCYSLRRARA